MHNSDIEPVRLNSESFISQSQYNFTWDNNGKIVDSALNFNGSLRSAKDIKVIWWRKPDIYQSHSTVTDPWAIKYAQEETKSLILSLSELFADAKWVNDYHKMRLPANRINQISVAHQIGISIPPTIVTNQYESALRFLQQYPGRS